MTQFLSYFASVGFAMQGPCHVRLLEDRIDARGAIMKKVRKHRAESGRRMAGIAISAISASAAATAAFADGERYAVRSYQDAKPAYSDVIAKPYIFYVGGAIGEYWLESEHKHQAVELWQGFPDSKAFIDSRASAKINGSDTTVSAFVGLEQRRNSWLLGLEFDANYYGFQRRTEVAPGPVPAGGGAGLTQADVFNSARIAHIETLRARIGYTFGHTTLFMTGGLAVGAVDFNQSINFPLSSASYADGRRLRAGWVVGGGFEHQLSRDVSLRAEYLYADLGKATYNYTNNCATGTTNPGCGGTYPVGFDHRVSYEVTTQIARVGLKVAMSEFGGGAVEPYKAGGVQGSYVDYSGMKTDFSGLYISPIAGTLSGRTTFALSRFNSGIGSGPNGELFPNVVAGDTPHKVSLNGFVFGGVLGYQKQFGNLLVGADVSLQSGAGSAGKADCTPNGTGNTAANLNGGSPITAECSSRLDYTTAFRARVGYAKDKWLMYVNGGPAFAKTENDVSYGGTVNKYDGPPVNASYFNEHGSAFSKGWTYGAGLEYEWKPGVIMGLSYNHTYLQDVVVDLRRNDGSTNSRRIVGVDPDVIGSSLKIKLGDTAQAPVQAPPAPATQQVAAAAAPPPAPAPAASPAAQRPRPAAARPSVQRPAAPAPAAQPAAAAPASAARPAPSAAPAATPPAVRVTPAAPAAKSTAPAPKATEPVDGTPMEPAPQMGKPQK
jgi:outer membrane immunogenic protein